MELRELTNSRYRYIERSFKTFASHVVQVLDEVQKEEDMAEYMKEVVRRELKELEELFEEENKHKRQMHDVVWTLANRFD